MTDDRIDKLERLGRLRESGSLSEEEFDVEKQRILGHDDARVISFGRLPVWLFAIVASLMLAPIGYGVYLKRADRDFESRLEGATRDVTQAIGRGASVAVPATASEAPDVDASRPAPPAPLSSGWVGEYTGRLDGGDGNLSVTRRGDVLDFSLRTASEVCMDEMDFRALAPSGNLIRHIEQPNEHDDQCILMLRRDGDQITVEEDPCTANHGFNCAFVGTLTR